MGDQKLELFYSSEQRLADIKNDPSVEIVELYTKLAAEFADMLDPRKGDHLPSEVWVYYPWLKKLVSICDEQTLWLLRTNRNMNLVNAEELEVLKSTGVLIAGLSVGSSMAIGLAYSGIKGPFYLADFDEISASNLNRLRVPLLAYGENKALIAAKSIYELDPFSTVNPIDTALNAEMVDEIIKNGDVKFIFDEVDDFRLKIDLRKKAQQYKLPHIMLTALGDTVLIDIERYDIDETTVPFNGLVSEGDLAVAYEDPSSENIKKLSVSIVGRENVPQRAVESLAEMGKTLSGRPQLYGTIALEGGIAAYIVREISLGRGPISGRYKIDLNQVAA